MNLKAVLAGAASALAISSVAHAAIVVTTFEGTVSSGADTAGVMKAAGTNLAGLGYMAVFTIDTTVNPFTDSTAWGPLEGVHNVGPVTPLISATFTVDGDTIALNPARFDVFTIGGFRYNLSDLCACLADPNGDEGHTFMFDAFSTLAPAHLNTPTSFVPEGANTYSYVALFDEEGEFLFEANGNIALVTTAVQTGAIPEPDAWALMILGFGAAGAALRKKQRVVSAR